MVQVEGWFISVETDAAGRYSHCQMMNPYFSKKGSVLLTFTLSRDLRALAVVVDTPAAPGAAAGGTAEKPPAAGPVASAMADPRQGTYAFDKGRAVSVPALSRGDVLRLELPDWPAFRAGLAGASRVVFSGGGRERTFNLYGVPEALDALEDCAKRGGLPPRVPVPKPGTPRAAQAGSADVPSGAAAAAGVGPAPAAGAASGSGTSGGAFPPAGGKGRGVVPGAVTSPSGDAPKGAEPPVSAAPEAAGTPSRESGAVATPADGSAATDGSAAPPSEDSAVSSGSEGGASGSTPAVSPPGFGKRRGL